MLSALVFADQAQASCRLALLLAIDVSSSVSPEEYALQQDGLAAALMSDDVSRAILNSSGGEVSFAVYEWSGRYQQSVVVDWTTLNTKASIEHAAAKISTHKRRFARYPTSMGFSLGYGAKLFENAPTCSRKVMDVSGDGINNDGFGPRMAYHHFPFEDVTVNGLVIEGSDPDVEWFYESNVLWGHGAFLEVAQGFEDFERTRTRKLYREISNIMIGQAPPQPRSSDASLPRL